MTLVDQIKARDTKQHAPTISSPPRTEIDLGWKVPARKHPQAVSPLSLDEEQGGEQEDEQEDSTATRRRLLKELSARLTRDRQLRSAQREFELQRLMMGKGARKRISATLVEGAENDQEDEDALDAMKVNN
ncbi:hypothetical protein AX16_000435 [Volvariella volvacea WC 439]|nr:hypothetical protein AX16_000435 [Volvariella volvacea WC 439]